jgi:hypothetical protein
MYERFTDRARKVMQLAHQEAQRYNQEYIGTEHILLGLIKERGGVAGHVLRDLGINLVKVRLEVETIIQAGPRRVRMDKLPLTPRAKNVIEYAHEAVENLNHSYVGTEHLLLGLLREGEGVAAQILMNLGLKLADVRKEVLQLLGHEIPSEENCSGRVLMHRWSRESPKQDGTPEKESSNSSPEETPPSAEHQRIRSLEKQLWHLRVLLGAVAGAVAGALLSSDKGVVVVGLVLGGIFAGLGGRILGAVAGGITGLLLGSMHLSGEGGGLAGALLGALAGVLIAEIGGPPDGRGFFRSRRKT